MLSFGPISSLFDFATFAVMLWVFHSGPAQFRSGWFVESLATQTLVIFAIRTRRIPFFRSHPSQPLTLAALAAVIVGALLPGDPAGEHVGLPRAAARLLRRAGWHGARLPGPDRDRQTTVLRCASDTHDQADQAASAPPAPPDGLLQHPAATCWPPSRDV